MIKDKNQDFKFESTDNSIQSTKTSIKATLFYTVLGIVGGHKFYLKHIPIGVVYAVCSGILVATLGYEAYTAHAINEVSDSMAQISRGSAEMQLGADIATGMASGVSGIIFWAIKIVPKIVLFIGLLSDLIAFVFYRTIRDGEDNIIHNNTKSRLIALILPILFIGSVIL